MTVVANADLFITEKASTRGMGNRSPWLADAMGKLMVLWNWMCVLCCAVLPQRVLLAPSP